MRVIKAKSILTRCNFPGVDFSANPYVGCMHCCKYCYAEYMTRFTNHSPPWGSFVDVKYWDEIKNLQKYSGKTIVISSVTDPYQSCETKYKRTHVLLEQLLDVEVNVIIITKSDLVLRDLNLIKRFEKVTVALSINTLDETFRRDMDCATSIERRIDVLKTLHDAEIPTVCFISPIFPKITNPQKIVLAVKEYCNMIWLENLNLKGANKGRILNYIYKRHNNLLPLYRDIYINNDMSYWQLLDNEIELFANTRHFKYTHDFALVENCDQLTIVNCFFHDKIASSNSNK